MKVLIIHNYYKTQNRGGEDIVFTQEVAALRRFLGSSVVYAYTAANDKARFWQIILGLFFRSRVYQEVLSIVRNEKIDIVHAHNLFPLISFAVFWAARRGGAQTVLTLHNYRLWCAAGTFFRSGQPCQVCSKKIIQWPGVFWGCYRGSRLQSLAVVLSNLWFWMSGAADRVSRFFVLSQSQWDLVKENLKHARHRLALKPNFICTALGKESWEAPSLRQKKLLYVGRFDEDKGIKYLVAAVEKLPQHITVRLIGDGVLRSWAQKRLDMPNVHFLGLKTHDEVLQEMARSGFVLQTSILFETFGLTIIEAMSVGCPVIGFPIGTRNDLIVHGYNGFLCEPNDLYDQIVHAVNCREYRQMQLNAKDFAGRYECDEIVRGQIDYYRKLVES